MPAFDQASPQPGVALRCGVGRSVRGMVASQLGVGCNTALRHSATDGCIGQLEAKFPGATIMENNY